jgi:hypothetical protein
MKKIYTPRGCVGNNRGVGGQCQEIEDWMSELV